MPGTAKELGMLRVFEPSYYQEAGTLLRRERKLRRKARKLIETITEKNMFETAEQARESMLMSLDCRKKRKALFSRYRDELLNQGQDDRLDPEKAIEYGFKYFAMMLDKQKGDVSLALASYNAGPHRVKQYAGIPPFAETVDYRNRVLRYYQGYLEKMNEQRGS
jgi:hypothetical protein